MKKVFLITLVFIFGALCFAEEYTIIYQSKWKGSNYDRSKTERITLIEITDPSPYKYAVQTETYDSDSNVTLVIGITSNDKDAMMRLLLELETYIKGYDCYTYEQYIAGMKEKKRISYLKDQIDIIDNVIVTMIYFELL